MPAGTNGDCLWILKNDNSPVCRAILATIMRKKLFVGILALALTVCYMLTLTGCSVKINSIGLPESEILEKGDTLALEISYGTENEATGEKLAEAVSKLTLVWVSTDEAVATVDETGLVTAVGPGEADVSVSIQDANLSSTCHVVVVVTATDFDVPDVLELSTNGEATRELGAKPNPADATNVSFSYSSSSDEVATVDENGVVTAVANGECDITVRMEQKNPVKEAVPEDDEPETQDADTQEVAPVEEAASDVSVEPSEATPSEEEASSEEQSEEGAPVVTDLELPDTNGATEGVVIEKTVHVVVTTAVEDVTLNNTEGILMVGNTYTIKATVTPENATDKTVTWTSSDEKVATVDANGKVTAKAVGTTAITAKAGDKSAEYKLTVQQVKCSYCGKTGHTPSNCPQKAADQQAKAAQQAAAQAAAAAAAQQQAAAAPSGDSGSSGGSSGGESAPAPSNPAPETPQYNPGDGSNGWDGNTLYSSPTDNGCPPEQMGIACGF